MKTRLMDSVDVAQECVAAASETSAIYFGRIETVADDCCQLLEVAVALKRCELVANFVALSLHNTMTDEVQQLDDQQRTIGRGINLAKCVIFE